MLRRHVLACLLTLALAPPAAAQTADTIDAFVTAELTRQRIPGLALVVVRDGRIAKVAGYGLADREKQVPGPRSARSGSSSSPPASCCWPRTAS
jgi:CubicO group peptidase (beta-lactamase class C family)